MLKSKIIIRLDDICETMDWDKFSYFKNALEDLGIRAVLGVVPNCKDPNLMVNAAHTDFYSLVRQWYEYGDTIAQHGFDHVYLTSDSGVMGVNDFSEFAGLSYAEQFDKLAAGKKILQSQNVWQPHFMAPAHSFDRITLACLADLGFTSVTDGYGFFPYKESGLTFVPQLFSKPLVFPFGIQTVALHLNNMSSDHIYNLLGYLKEHIEHVISYESVLTAGVTDSAAQRISRIFVKNVIGLKRALNKYY